MCIGSGEGRLNEYFDLRSLVEGEGLHPEAFSFWCFLTLIYIKIVILID